MSGHGMSASPPTSRVIAILDILSDYSANGLSSSEVARIAGLSTSTTASILSTLDEATYVERLQNRSYRLGRGLLKLLSGLHGRYPLLGAADDELSRLSTMTGCGCSLARVDPGDLEVVLKVGGGEGFEPRVGHRVPLGPPYGCMAVAWRSPEHIEEWLSTAPQSLARSDADALRRVLGQIRSCGYAVYSVERDVQTTLQQLSELLDQADNPAPIAAMRRQLSQLAAAAAPRIYTTTELVERQRRPVSYVIAPVFGPEAQPRYLVSLHIMRELVPAHDLDHYTQALLQSAKALSAAIGGRWPDTNAVRSQLFRG